MSSYELHPLSEKKSFFSKVTKKLRKPLMPVIFVFGFEALFGHVALRTSWRGGNGSYEPENMVECTLVSFPTFETHHFYSYEPLVSLVQPKTTMFEWSVRTIKEKVSSVAKSMTKPD